MKDLTKTRFHDDNRDDIVHYLEAGGFGNTEGIVLTDKQIELLDRWKFADEKIRENKYKMQQVAQFIIGKFDVSRDTAFRDIVNAQYVLSSALPLNKSYLIQSRIDFLISKIADAYIDHDRLGASMLEKVLQKYIDMYPEAAPLRSPKIINFLFQQNILVTVQKAENAFMEADDIIKELEDGKDVF